MTAYRFVTLTCDECGEISDGGMDTSVKQARATARAANWRYWFRKDLCPRHFGFYWSEVAGWVYHPQIAEQRAKETGHAYWAPTTVAAP